MAKETPKPKKIKLLGEYDETIDIYFKRNKINLLVSDYLNLLMEMQKREDVNPDTILNSSSLLNTLIVKHFSTIQLPNELNIETLIATSKELLEKGVMNDLFGNADNSFPIQEIEKLKRESEKQYVKFIKTQKKILNEISEGDINA